MRALTRSLVWLEGALLLAGVVEVAVAQRSPPVAPVPLWATVRLDPAARAALWNRLAWAHQGAPDDTLGVTVVEVPDDSGGARRLVSPGRELSDDDDDNDDDTREVPDDATTATLTSSTGSSSTTTSDTTTTTLTTTTFTSTTTETFAPTVAPTPALDAGTQYLVTGTVLLQTENGTSDMVDSATTAALADYFNTTQVDVVVAAAGTPSQERRLADLVWNATYTVQIAVGNTSLANVQQAAARLDGTNFRQKLHEELRAVGIDGSQIVEILVPMVTGPAVTTTAPGTSVLEEVTEDSWLSPTTSIGVILLASALAFCFGVAFLFYQIGLWPDGRPRGEMQGQEADRDAERDADQGAEQKADQDAERDVDRDADQKADQEAEQEVQEEMPHGGANLFLDIDRPEEASRAEPPASEGGAKPQEASRAEPPATWLASPRASEGDATPRLAASTWLARGSRRVGKHNKIPEAHTRHGLEPEGKVRLDQAPQAAGLAAAVG